MTDPPPRGETGILRGSALLFVAQVTGNVGFFVAVLLLARGLHTSGRGAIAFFVVVVTLAARLSRFGLVEATMVFAAQDEKRRPVLLGNLLVFSAATGCFGGLAALGFLFALGSERPDALAGWTLVCVFVGVVALTAFEAAHGYLLGASQLWARAVSTGFGSWLYAALLVVIWTTSGLTVANAATAWVASTIVSILITWVPAVRAAGLARPDFRLLVESVRFGARAWVGSLASFLNFRLDQIILGVLTSASVLGVYAVAVNVSEVLLYLPEAVALALLPSVARSGDSVHTLRTFRILTLISLGTIAVAAVVAPYLIPIVFGEEYRGAAAPFLWLLPGALGYGAMRVFSNALLATSAPGLSSLGPSVALVLGVALDFALIPAFGAEGAAAAASAAFLAGGATAAIAYRRHRPFPWRALAVEAAS